MAPSPQEVLPWKISFAVQFNEKSLGMVFQENANPEATQGGVFYTTIKSIRKITNESDRKKYGSAQKYNSRLKPWQEHLRLRKGLLLTHINKESMNGIPARLTIQRLKMEGRPLVLHFADAGAGMVSKQEMDEARDFINKAKDPDHLEVKGPEIEELGNNETNEHEIVPEEIKKTYKSAPLLTKSRGISSEKTYKIILLGDVNVGKSSLLSVAVNGDEAYNERKPSTLEPEFFSYPVPDPDISKPSNLLKCRIWDTAGQERFLALTRHHYRDADGALLVYDVSEKRSFEMLDVWLRELRKECPKSLKSIVLVENKVDRLPVPITGKEGRPSNFVSESRVSAYCKANGLSFVRTSAKCNSTCFKWQGQKIESVVNQLVLNVHATQLSREKANASSGNDAKHDSSKPDSLRLGVGNDTASGPLKAECCY